MHRILRLAEDIGSDITCDTRVFAVAAYLHDRGAFPCDRQSGVAHALRSRQIAGAEILSRMDSTGEQTTLILEAIEQHDYR